VQKRCNFHAGLLRQESTREHTHADTHTVIMFNCYCFSTATMVTHMCLHVVLHIHCLSQNDALVGRGVSATTYLWFCNLVCDIVQESCGEVPDVYFATEAGNLTNLQIFVSEAFCP